MARPSLSVLALAATLLVSGCVVPFVVPPLRGSASAGAAAGQLDRPVPGVMPTDRVGGITEIRGAIHPLQLADREGARRWDVGAGWLYQVSVEEMLELERHGPFLEVGYRLWRRPLNELVSLRLSVHGGGDLLIDGGALAGGGGTLGLTIEAVTWASGPFEADSEDGVILGGAEGESSVGLVALTGLHAIDGTAYWTMTFGVSLRSPGLAGVAIFIPDRI